MSFRKTGTCRSLEKIFIEERIYRDIEECETWESVIETIDKGLKPFRKRLLAGCDKGRYNSADRNQDQADIKVRFRKG